MSVSAEVDRQIRRFSEDLDDKFWPVDLFNGIPDLYFYVKDRNSRWVVCNDAGLRLLGVKTKDQAFGRTEHDFFPKPMADAIHVDDQSVMSSGRRIVGKTEIVLDEYGLLTWVSTNKLPLYGKDGTIIGLMGTTRVLKRYDDLPESHQPFGHVVEYIQDHISGPISIERLSRVVNLSVSQFRKRFRAVFGISPNEFILRTRLQKAARLLRNADDALIKIALDCGFCDQSYFTKRFHDFFGVTPRQYRNFVPHGLKSPPDRTRA